MTSRTHEPIRKVLPDCMMLASDRCAEWSYERLEELRSAAVMVRDSEFVWPHEQTHLAEVVARVDATVNLKRERESYWSKKKRGDV